MGRDEEPLVVEVYKAYIEDVNQLRAARAVQDGLYVTILTLLLGAQGYIANAAFAQDQLPNLMKLEIGTWIPVMATAGVGLIGFVFCGNWRRVSSDSRKSINFKFKNIESMERDHPVLKSAGAQLFLSEYYDRHPEARPPDQEGNSSPSRSSSSPQTTQRSGRGVAAAAAELQILFRNVFLLLGLGIPFVKAAIVTYALMNPWLAQWHSPH